MNINSKFRFSPIQKVAAIAIDIPTMPNKLPILDEVGDDNPRRASINKTAATK